MTFFEDRPGADKVEELIQLAIEARRELLLSVVNWGEVYYSVWRARGPGVARKILADGKFESFVADRYSSFDSGFGRDIEKRRVGFRELNKLVLGKLGEPKPKSGKQEYLENLLNTYLHG